MWTWFVIAVIAAIGEAFTFDLFLASIAGAAVVAALLATAVVSVAVQVAVFAILSLAGILVIRPAVKHALGIDASSATSGSLVQSHIVGKRATVTALVDASGGQIRIGQGEFWSARAYDADAIMHPGETVEIVLVDGITALVTPVAKAPLTESHVSTGLKGS